MKADRSPFSAHDVRSFVLRVFWLHITARLLQRCFSVCGASPLPIAVYSAKPSTSLQNTHLLHL